MAASDVEARLKWLEERYRDLLRRAESLEGRVAQLEQQLRAVRQAPNA